MEISLSLSLPRDEASVPFVRHVCGDALGRLGVAPDCVSDVEIAITEACTNVVKHSADAREEYNVKILIDETSCHITVTDGGSGFDHEARSSTVAGADDESGRGIGLMHALVDKVKFVSKPEDGTIVHLVKNLELGEESLTRRLERSSAASYVS
jgi:serine/threonine-protein kinase RsbW